MSRRASYFTDPLYNTAGKHGGQDETGAGGQGCQYDSGDVIHCAKLPNLKHADPRTLNHPGAEIDARNGWRDRGAPEENFEEEGPSPISLAADELADLFRWILLGGERRTGPRPAHAHDMGRVQLEKVLARPSLIARRFMALLLRMRPDLLDGMEAKQVAARLRISPRMMAFYCLNFSQRFPTACKMIRRQSRLMSAEILKARHRK